MHPLTPTDPVLAKIEQRLMQSLSIAHLSLVDDSSQHQGHAEAPGHAASHITLCVISADFQSKTPLARHRLIYAALGDLMGTVIHAIHINAKTPDEWEKEETKHV